MSPFGLIRLWLQVTAVGSTIGETVGAAWELRRHRLLSRHPAATHRDRQPSDATSVGSDEHQRQLRTEKKAAIDRCHHERE
jgi:hypothetical protein